MELKDALLVVHCDNSALESYIPKKLISTFQNRVRDRIDAYLDQWRMAILTNYSSMKMNDIFHEYKYIREQIVTLSNNVVLINETLSSDWLSIQSEACLEIIREHSIQCMEIIWWWFPWCGIKTKEVIENWNIPVEVNWDCIFWASSEIFTRITKPSKILVGRT